MTCIVGIVDEGGVLLGGDSAGVSGYELVIRADPKVFELGPFLIGFTSSFRMGQLLRYGFTPPVWRGGALFEFMATTFVDAVRARLTAGGFAKKENEQEEGGTFLVGYRRRLFVVHSDYQVEEAVAPYASIGSGSQVAMGALAATEDPHSDLLPSERLRVALEAAESHNIGVRGPFVFIYGATGEVVE